MTNPRASFLKGRSAAIITDIERVFNDVTLPELAMTIEYARKAINAHADGHTEAALARH